MQTIKFPFTVQLKGDSCWDYEGPSTVTVSAISIQYRDANWDECERDAPGATVSHVSVDHDTTWDIYTDSGFEAAISDRLGFDVSFTEQGMQDDGYASMEP